MRSTYSQAFTFTLVTLFLAACGGGSKPATLPAEPATAPAAATDEAATPVEAAPAAEPVMAAEPAAAPCAGLTGSLGKC